MDEQKRNLLEIFFGMQDYFSPKIIGEVNDVFVKLAKVKGEDVPRHTHAGEDELFYVVKGRLMMEIKGRESFELKDGELFIVKRGVEHRVHSEDECWLLLIENKTAKHTGEVHSSITKTVEQQRY
jgi:mannose-6-phosphate isomerase-like protein (cupin superfamily)